jgi:NhaP-type Na+/H+ or K+/H+ antiporter
MNLSRQQLALIAGALIGAILGAGTAYLLTTTSREEYEPVTATDLMSLTGSAAVLIRKMDDLRRKL